jgi:hypothetical protein
MNSKKSIIQSKFSSSRNESILDEKYIEIQNIATKHLTTLQNVVTALKNKRQDVSLDEFPPPLIEESFFFFLQ